MSQKVALSSPNRHVGCATRLAWLGEGLNLPPLRFVKGRTCCDERCGVRNRGGICGRCSTFVACSSSRSGRQSPDQPGNSPIGFTTGSNPDGTGSVNAQLLLGANASGASRK